MGEVRRDLSGVCTNNHQFLVLGGAFQFQFRLKSSKYYDKNTNKWTPLPNIEMPTARYRFGAVWFDYKVFVMGGSDGLYDGSARSDLLCLPCPGGDLSALTKSSAVHEWKSLRPMLEGRNRFAYVSHSNSIYVFGGFADIRDKTPDEGERYPRLDTAERYDIATNTWTRLPTMPRKCAMSAAGVVGNKIYVVGGSDRDGNALADTLAFDIATQKWETPTSSNAPAVPAMKTKREGLSVVTVDHYIVALGGYNGNKTLSSIEVLDTRRNTWKRAKTKMRKPNSLGVARVFENTKEIIFAGGTVDTDTVETIHFEHGLLPPSYGTKDRGQEIIGDTDRGEDRLGVSTIADALAETLVFKDLKPPFVLAVFGKWGRGKSYFFNLMQETIISIQKRPMDNLFQNTFAGHIYIVKFDAWTFSKGDVWSSLMYQILQTLNEQLQFEEALGKDALLSGDVSTIEVFRDLSTLEIEHLKEHRSILQNIKKDGDRASERLLRAINANYAQDEEDLKQIEKHIHLERTKKEAIRSVEQIKVNVNFLGKQALDRVLKKALDESVGNEDTKSIDDLIQSIKRMNRFFLWAFSLRLSNVSPAVAICSALLIVFSSYLYLDSKAEDKIVSKISGLLAVAVPILTSISSALHKIDPVITNLQRQAEHGGNFDAESGRPLLGSLPGGNYGSFDDKVLQDLKIQKTEIENRSLALKGNSLRDAIAKHIDSSDYENNLGIVHKVQKDLKLISDGMLNQRQRDIFPRGDPRIVLFIDDLDRCKHTEVVKVIEALQLLVKTKLFVAVLAIDPRYVTLSLEKHYNGVLDPIQPPTGMDFLEKMIQIPFRLPGAFGNSIDDFIDAEITVEEPEDEEEDIETPAQTPDPVLHSMVFDNPRLESDDVEELVDTLEIVSDPENVEAVADGPAEVVAEEVEEDLPSNKIQFTSSEKQMLKEIFKLFGVEPRCMRRIVNVVKVLKVIWRREKTSKFRRFEENDECKRATLFLMLLASDNLTRRVTYKIFHWMESGTVQYHRVMNEDETNPQNSLSNLIKTELQKDKRFNSSRSTRAIREQGGLMAYIDKYLAGYTWKNANEWNAVASKFLLARSFTFYRLVTSDMVMTEQNSFNVDDLPLRD